MTQSTPCNSGAGAGTVAACLFCTIFDAVRVQGQSWHDCGVDRASSVPRGLGDSTGVVNMVRVSSTIRRHECLETDMAKASIMHLMLHVAGDERGVTAL